MEYRGEDNSDAGEECDTAEQCVTTGKDFSRRGLEFAQRPHAREDHGGIGERIDPIHVLESVITKHADAQCNDDKGQRECRVAAESREEQVTWQKRFGTVFVHSQFSRW